MPRDESGGAGSPGPTCRKQGRGGTLKAQGPRPVGEGKAETTAA